MRTLVVLSALAAIALAAPAHQEDGSSGSNYPDWHSQPRPSIEDILKREKKSTLITEEPESTRPNLAGRSFHLKKPLIVKKKFGHSTLFRDSEEEKAQADSHESCGRQVKVKLCDEDGKFKDMFRSSTHEISNAHPTEEEMKYSIKMAKEAVEHLQRDLKKMEQDNAALKMAHDSNVDSELHKDIEVARQALEHIDRNLDVTVARDSEPLEDVHFIMAKSEEEKMAQWKEAMVNINKNVEIARSIEDSFKATNSRLDMAHLDQHHTELGRNQQLSEEDADSQLSTMTEHVEEEHMRNVETADQKTQTLQKQKNEQEDKEITEQSTLQQAREDIHTEDDMSPSASEVIAMKTVNIDNHHTLRSENHKRDEYEQKTEEKLEDEENHKKSAEMFDELQNQKQLSKNAESELVKDSLKDTAGHHHPLFMKETENPTDMKSDTAKDFKKSAVNKDSDDIEEDLRHETSLSEIDHLRNQHAKSVDTMLVKPELNVDMGKSAEKLEHQMSMKSSDTDQALFRETGNTVNKMDTDLQITDNIPQPHDLLMRNSDTLSEPTEHESEHQLAGVKSAEDLHYQLPGVISIDNYDKNHKEKKFKLSENDDDDDFTVVTTMFPPTTAAYRHMSIMKAAEDLEDFHGMDQMRSPHFTDHHHISNNMGLSHNFEMPEPHHHLHSHTPSKFHHHQLSHSNLHDMNSMSNRPLTHNFHPSMREAMEGSEHMFRWAPNHETSRSAYGSSLSGSIGSSGGAVGVFPNANVGSCGIPLLLSCSPSVVSGSLAKAHASGQSSYTAPSYRTEDEFSFHNKRDIMKPAEIRGTKVLRTPSTFKTEDWNTLREQIIKS